MSKRLNEKRDEKSGSSAKEETRSRSGKNESDDLAKARETNRSGRVRTHNHREKSASRDQESCSVCRKLRDESRDDDMLVRNEVTGLTVCLECAVEAVLILYAAGARSEALQDGLIDLFSISAETEAEILQEQREILAKRYQARLLSMREPVHSDEQVVLTVKVGEHVRDKVQALADEASVSVSTWLRKAISLAFEATSVGVTERRDERT